MANPRIVLIVGTRPNLVKAAPLLRQLESSSSRFKPILIHSGQHSDKAMSDNFFSDLNISPAPVNLGASGVSRQQQVNRIRKQLIEKLNELKPGIVVVFGDVTSTAAGALAAAELNLPLAHVEAGLRSFDRSMPEETNRMVADRLADLHLISEPSGVKNLKAERRHGPGCHLVGNIMIDSLVAMQDNIEACRVLGELGLKSKQYALLTLHRPENVDLEYRLKPLLETMKQLGQTCPVLFPCHPRTKKTIEAFKLDKLIDQESLRLLDPLSYTQFVKLQSEASLVLTDSGGVQEETTFLGVPCLTLRNSTERPITIEIGTNQLVGTDPVRIMAAANLILAGGQKSGQIPELWDGHTAERIVAILEETI